MGEVTREEIDAKLETIEARLETRLVSMDAKLDKVLDRLDLVAADAKEAKTEARSARNAAGGLIWNFAFVAFAAVAILIAVYALGYQIADILRPR